MDNRSYDPDQQRKDPLVPDGSAEQKSHTLGEHHEQPVPVDPLQGIVGDPTAQTGIGSMTSSDVVRPSYPEFTEQAIEHQVPHAANQPTGAAPPYTSAHVGGATPPPPESPYTPHAYASGPGQPPPTSHYAEEKKGGFNWLACCGISCGLALVLGIVFFYAGYKYFKPLISAGMQLNTVAEDVKQNGAPEQADIEVTVEELGANPAQFEGQWVALTGKVADDPGGPVDSMRQQQGMQESSAYFIEPNIVVMDMSTTQPVARQGDTISVIGKPVVLDFEKLLGPLASRQIEKENELEDMKTMVFVVTDKVVVDSSSVPNDEMPENETPSEEPPADT
jgi:hypothetical protein